MRPLEDLAEREELLLLEVVRLAVEALRVRASALTSATQTEDATKNAASVNVSGLNLVKTRFLRNIQITIRGYQERIISSVFCVSNTTQDGWTPCQAVGSRSLQRRNSMTTRIPAFLPGVIKLRSQLFLQTN